MMRRGRGKGNGMAMRDGTGGDARFADGGARALRLWATSAEDLQVVAALCQDAVLPASEMRWSRSRRQVSLLLNRVRREPGAPSGERVRTLLTVSDVASVRGQGVVPGDADTVLSLLTLDWAPGPDADGRLLLTFAGDGVAELACDCLDVMLRDVTRPYAAPSGRDPSHPD